MAIIESTGAVTLDLFGGSIYRLIGPSDVTLKYGFAGAAFVSPGQFGAWTPIGAEQSGSGYQVVWKNGGADQYIVWNCNSDARWISQGAVLSGASFALQSLETTFGQDFNNDLTIGPATTVVESSGSTTLSQVAGTYFLYADGTSSGPQLKYGGAVVAPGQFGTWTPLGAERSGSGYQIVWKNGAADQYIVWNVDSNGNWLSQGSVLSAASAALRALEPGFDQNLNGIDGISSRTIIDDSGSTGLDRIANVYMLVPSGGTVGPLLKYGGTVVTPSQFGAWTPLGAEQSGSGYQVVWKNGSADQYIVWNVDGGGKWLSQGAVLTGASAELRALEASFEQDLNGADGISANTSIESLESASLVQTVANTYMVVPDGGSTGPQLRYAGGLVTAGQFGGWTPVGAEQKGSGYQVVWQHDDADQYIVWNVGSGGNWLSQGAVLSGASVALQSLETTFGQDFNGDTTVGLVTVPIESFGSTTLTKAANAYFLDLGSSGPAIVYGGRYVTEGQFGAWTPIAAERTMGGYEVAWKNGADQYIVWNLDSGGNWISQSVVMSGNSAALQALEASFQQNLNLDPSVVAASSIEDDGSTVLARVGNGYLLDAASGWSGPLLSYSGAYVTAGQFGAWTPIGAEWTGNGYQVAWQMGLNDRYVVWNTDRAGNFVSQTGVMFGSSSALESFEYGLQQDINGDGLTGVPTPAFNIAVSYSGDQSYAHYFTAAAQRWQQVITGDLPDVYNAIYGYIDDVLISATVGAIDGRGGILGQAGPDYIRTSGSLPTHGIMRFDAADLETMASDGTLYYVILHEMGHVLGIGSMWSYFGLSGGSQYYGQGALNAYRLLNGSDSAFSVPLESQGGSGTAGVHWSEAVFGSELMTGYIAGTPAPLSTVTIGSLQDMGYTVNYSAADAFALSGHLVANGTQVGSATANSGLPATGQGLGDALFSPERGADVALALQTDYMTPEFLDWLFS